MKEKPSEYTNSGNVKLTEQNKKWMGDSAESPEGEGEDEEEQ